MPRRPLAFLALALVAALVGGSLTAQRGAEPAESGDIARARGELRQALSASQAATARRAWLEREAESARDAAERTAREAAALAGQVQQSEAEIAAAQARLSLANREYAGLREALGQQQQPLVRLTGALQQVSRRPLALSLLRPGSVADLVHLRAVLDSTLPQVAARTAGLRGQLARGRQLRAEALAANQSLEVEQARLAGRSRQLAALGARQRQDARQASGSADREAARALQLAEQARDLDALIGELGRAGDVRARLAALPGPILRPARPEQAGLAVVEPPAPVASATAPPAPYGLPVTGRAVLGFGATTAQNAQPSAGLTLAPLPGAQVVAPAGGRVAFAGPYRGYGQIVIIEHPGGWTSLVTGLARSDVDVGDTLVAGAPLGVASEANPRVTLELRRGGEPVNPLRFVG